MYIQRDMGAGTGSSKRTTAGDGCIGYCLQPDDTNPQASPYDQHQQLHLKRPYIHCLIMHCRATLQENMLNIYRTRRFLTRVAAEVAA